MNLQERIDAFAGLQTHIRLLEEQDKNLICENARRENSWFSPESVLLSLENISTWLDKASLTSWAQGYTYAQNTRTVGLVAAGNIPLVGFHDLLCVLMAGHKASVKLSHQDSYLMRHMASLLVEV
ncbi:MAG: acyl-CoA reductase, partial [Cytophagales bacterium]|nr:acyl-CoA reductase [Cytophagales bacterium]